MLNVVAIMGRLARDPEMRQTTTGKNVASFRIACDRGRRDVNGQSQADWLDVVAWDRIAEFICKYFQNGSLIVIDGRLQTRQYQDKNGQNRTAVEIVANNVNFGQSRSIYPSTENAPENAAAAPERTQSVQRTTQSVAPRYSSGNNEDFAMIEDEGDLPF
jgi:single-strand DNA-binding protein